MFLPEHPFISNILQHYLGEDIKNLECDKPLQSLSFQLGLEDVHLSK